MKKLVNYFRIKLGLHEMDIPFLLIFANGIHTTGDPDITNVSFTDAQIQALALIVQNDAAARQTTQSKTLTATEQGHVNDLCVAIESVKNDVEVQANKKASGNRNIFNTIVTRVGMNPRAQAKKLPRSFEFLIAEAGSYHLRQVVPGQGKFTFYFRVAITTAIGVIPTNWESPIALPVVEYIMNGFPSGTVIAAQHGVLMHPKHTKKTANKKVQKPNEESAVLKSVTIPTVNNKGKIVLTHGVDFIHWSDIIYYVIGGSETSGTPKLT